MLEEEEEVAAGEEDPGFETAKAWEETEKPPFAGDASLAEEAKQAVLELVRTNASLFRSSFHLPGARRVARREGVRSAPGATQSGCQRALVRFEEPSL